MEGMYRMLLVGACVFGASLLIASAPASVEAGFGVSPPSIREENLVPGSRFERTIYLVQGNPNRDVPVTVTVDSADVKDWISLENGSTFVIPSGVQQYPLKVTVHVPADAALGEYRAFLRINTEAPKTTEAGQVAIALGGKIDVYLTVGDNVVRSFDVTSIKLLDIKEGEPLEVSLRISNTGNVSVAPEAVTFDLFNKFGDVRLGYSESREVKQVSSFSEDTILLSFPLDIRLAPGEYWGHVKVYDEGAQVEELRTVFNVLPKTFLERNLIPVGSGLAIVLVAFVALFFVRMWRWKKVRRRTL